MTELSPDAAVAAVHELVAGRELDRVAELKLQLTEAEADRQSLTAKLAEAKRERDGARDELKIRYMELSVAREKARLRGADVLKLRARRGKLMEFLDLHENSEDISRWAQTEIRAIFDGEIDESSVNAELAVIERRVAADKDVIAKAKALVNRMKGAVGADSWQAHQWLDPDSAALFDAVDALVEVEDTPQPQDQADDGRIPKGFGRRNPHCSNCGDERGGMFGHEISECSYRSGMTAAEVARILPEERRAEFWDLCVDRYMTAAVDRDGEVER